MIFLNHPPKLHGSRQQGFTMVELIAVIIIVGIIASVAASRFFNATTFQSRAAADQVRAALKYGQKIAIAQRRQVGVLISTSASAQTNCTNTVSSSTVTCAISNAVTTLTTGTYYFNSLGEPVNAGGTPIIAAGTSNPAASITVGNISDGGATILIEQETGYVH